MNFWHIQLHPNDRDAFPTDKVERILRETSYIGLGEWKEGTDQIRKFRNDMEEKDIVVVRSGKTPIALVEVVGKAEIKKDPDPNLDWFENRRKIKILDFYSDEYNFSIPRAQGTLAICSNPEAETTKIILNWYNKIIQNRPMERILHLLKSKPQVILQGPPGTGKTRLAKQVAASLVKPNTIGNPKEIIDGYIKTFDSTNERVVNEREVKKKLISEFQSKFPMTKLKDMSLEDYCIGTDENNSFCWWIERGLRSLGTYSPFTSTRYLIYWNKDSDSYSKHGFVKSLKSDEEAMKQIASLLYEVVSTKTVDSAKDKFRQSFLLKILNSYYPEEYFPINSERILENALSVLSIDNKELDAFQKNRKLNETFKHKQELFASTITSYEFSNFLFNQFNIKSGEYVVRKNQLVAHGEYKLIQFHPSYSYEDFVRGIIAETSDSGGITYKVENKLLADFAQKAKDNPNGNYVLIIDEINRANLPAVLGELIYALEYRYDPNNEKETTVDSIYSFNNDRSLSLPNNLYIIGTMNTADRSVGHIDYAIRRRFAFIEMPADEKVITNPVALDLFRQIRSMFEKYIASDFNINDVLLGHSYFLAENNSELKLKLEYEALPILKEYLKDGVLIKNDALENDWKDLTNKIHSIDE